MFQRFKFWNRSQQEEESVDQFSTELKRMIKNCKYTGSTGTMVRDRLVLGIRDAKVQSPLLRNDVDKLTLERALSYCRSTEATESQRKEIRGQLTEKKVLRANVGIYRESQISSEKSSFGFYHPNNPLVWLFQKMILRNTQALCIWIILEKFENSQKNTIFIHEISQNFERFQRNSTDTKDLLLTSSSSHI